MKPLILQNWFNQQRRRSRRFVPLYKGILSNSGWRYLVYRLRYFALIVVICSLIHLVEFGAIFHFIGINTLVTVALIRGVFFATNAVYWGFLEILRTKIRNQYKERAYNHIQQTIRNWLSLSFSVGLLIAASYFIVSIYITQSFSQYSLFLKVYSVCIFIELIFELMVLTFQASVYSLKRIARPSTSIYASHIVGLVLLITLWPFIQIYSLLVAQLSARFTRLFLSYFYTKRSYKMLNLHRTLKAEKIIFTKSFRGAFSLEALSAALASLIMRCEGIIILLLFLFHTSQSSTHDTFILFFFLIAPFIMYSFSWSKLFYFDFKLLEYFPLNTLSKILLKRIIRLACLIGIIFWFLASMVALYFHQVVFHIMWLLLPFFLLRAPISILQIHAFCMRRYADVIISGSLTLASLIMIANSSLPLKTLFIILILMMTMSFIYLIYIRSKPIKTKPDYYFPISFYDWILLSQHHIKKENSHNITLVILDNNTTNHQARLITDMFAKHIEDNGAITQKSAYQLLIYLKKENHSLHQKLRLSGAGYIKEYRAINLDDLLLNQSLSQNAHLTEICKIKFPDAIIISATYPTQCSHELDYASLKYAVTRALRQPHYRPTVNNHQLSLEIDANGIKTFFLIPKSNYELDELKKWHATVLNHNYLTLRNSKLPLTLLTSFQPQQI